MELKTVPDYRQLFLGAGGSPIKIMINWFKKIYFLPYNFVNYAHTCAHTHTEPHGYHRNWKILKTGTVSRCNKGVKAMMKQEPQYGRKIDTNTERSKDRKAKCPEWQNSTETIGSVGLLLCPE